MTVQFQCSFGGVPFCLPPVELDLYLNGTAIYLGSPVHPASEDDLDLGDTDYDQPDDAPPNGLMPVDELRILNEPRTWPGPGLVGITFPLRYTQRPNFKFNEFFYPTGSCRWSEFHGIMSQAEYDQIVPLCFPDGGSPVPQSFIMQQDSQQIQTELYMLPPRPLATTATGSDYPYYLISLVDVRFFWQWNSPGAVRINETTTWALLINQLAGALSISWANSFSPESVYGQPHPFSDLYSNYENSAVMLDAALGNIGRVLVRNLDGSFDALRSAQSDSRETGNQPTPFYLLAGGSILQDDLLTDGDTNNAIEVILPASVKITFPLRYATGLQTFVNVQSAHIPFNRTEGDVWAETVTLAEAGYSQYQGGPGTKIIHTTGDAWVYTAMDASPLNETQVRSLAVQLATDFYNWQVTGLDQVFPGIYPWAPDANNDITWLWDRDRTWTRIQRHPYNAEQVEYLHHFLTPGSSSSTSGASGSVSNSHSGGGGSTSFSSTGSTSTSASTQGCPAFVCDVQCVNGMLQTTVNPITQYCGDLIVNNGAGYNVRLGVGAPGTVLTADPTQPLCIAWEQPQGGNSAGSKIAAWFFLG